jgi:hypothetical protein
MNKLPDKPPGTLDHSELVNTLLPSAISILENDLRLSGIDFQITGKFIGDVFDLKDFISPAVNATGGPGSEAFYRLLYRVDIPEEKVRIALNTASEQPISAVISELLIIRALQKAYYRLKFNERI